MPILVLTSPSRYASSEPCPLGPPPKGGGDGKPSLVVLSTTKGYSYNYTSSHLFNYHGLFMHIGGTISTQVR